MRKDLSELYKKLNEEAFRLLKEGKSLNSKKLMRLAAEIDEEMICNKKTENEAHAEGK